MWRFEIKVLYLTSTLLLFIIVSKLPCLFKHRKELKSKSFQTPGDLLDSQCTLPQLPFNVIPVNMTEPMCRRILPSRESCHKANYVFESKPAVNCSRQRNIEICKLQYGNNGIMAVNCRINRCYLPIIFGYLKPLTGKLIWQQFYSKKILENIILKHIIPGKRPKNFGHVYIKCHTNKTSSLPDAEQILIIPPNYIKSSKSTDSKRESPLSINILFLDSMSRHHFYRSLPRTVTLFSELNRNNTTSVLDFRFVQTVRSRTFESLQALFMGFINTTQIPFHSDAQRKQLKLAELLGKFKTRGYQTLWLEDICMLSLWGLAKDLCIASKDTKLSEEGIFQRFTNALKDAHIDSVDVTLSSCRLLFSDLGKRNPFYDVDSICFNGRHQHEYFLEYLNVFQKFMVNQGTPFISFFESNIAHENTGRRVRSLDTHLEQYIKATSNLDNVITIIVSDHGNTYGDFVERTFEGQLEMYHTPLFFIVTPGVASFLGPSKLKNLIENQNRLISLLDLHYTLRSLVTDEPVHQRNLRYHVTVNGLFDPISPRRTCDDMPMIAPNLCMCEDYESKYTNDSSIVIYAHFVIGKINNEIQNQYNTNNVVNGHRLCKLLSLNGFGNVKKHVQNGNKMTLKMNLMVHSGKTFNKQPDAFFATITVQSGIITLQNLDRISTFSRYSNCAAIDGVQPSLCVCDVENMNGSLKSDPLDQILMMTPYFNMISDLSCLIYINGTNDYGFILYAINECGIDVNVRMRIYPTSMLLSTKSLINEVVRKDGITFLTSGVKINDDWSWYFTDTVKIIA